MEGAKPSPVASNAPFDILPRSREGFFHLGSSSFVWVSGLHGDIEDDGTIRIDGFLKPLDFFRGYIKFPTVHVLLERARICCHDTIESEVVVNRTGLEHGVSEKWVAVCDIRVCKHRLHPKNPCEIGARDGIGRPWVYYDENIRRDIGPSPDGELSR